MGTPTEIAVAQAAIDHARSGVKTTYPAVVVAYNTATGRASLLLGQAGQTLEGLVDPPTPLPDVPVLWTEGNVGRLDPGAEVLVVVCARELDRWLAAGGAGVPLASDRMHDFTDALCLPTRGFSLAKPPPPAAATALVHGREDGTATIMTTYAPAPPLVTIEAPGVGSIQLGAGATAPNSALAFARSLHTYLVQLFTAAQVAGSANAGAISGEVEADAALIFLAANPFTQFATVKVVAE